MKFFKNKRNTKKHIAIIGVLLLILMLNTNSYARINGATNEVSEVIKQVLGFVLNNAAAGVLGSTIVPLINVFTVLIFLIIYILFVSTNLTNGLAFPFPDDIIFNRIPILDPNFINPDDRAVGKIAEVVIKDLYSSFFVLATSIFVVAALIIGVKLVFSSIAAEKAQYKKSLNVWIIGIFMLFFVHYLLAGMFYLNEEIVAAVSKIADGIEFAVLDTTSIGAGIGSIFGIAGTGIGKAIGSLVGGIADIFGVDLAPFKVGGYTGLVLKFFLSGVIGRDLVSSIVCAIILGQTFALIITYVKRAFMCIFLGMLAPIVVAIDVIQKALK